MTKLNRLETLFFGTDVAYASGTVDPLVWSSDHPLHRN